MESSFSNKTMTEAAREIKVSREADVVVIGGGSGGIGFDCKLNNNYRAAWLAFTFWLANVDIQRLTEFEKAYPEKHTAMIKEICARGGYGHYFKGLLKNQEGVIWFHNFLAQPRNVNYSELKSNLVS